MRQGVLLAFCASIWGQAGPPILAPGGIVDSAGYSRELAPGMIISAFGDNFAAEAIAASALPLPTTLGGASLEVLDGGRVQPAPLFFVSPRQINAQLPFDLAGPGIQARVRNANGVSAADSFPLLVRTPRVFTWTMDGKGDAIAVHADYSPISSGSPAKPGETAAMYLTGLGAVNPPIPAGAAPEGNNVVTEPVQVFLAGLPAEVLFAGLAPGFAGLYQVNFKFPAGVPAGRQPVRVRTGSQESQSNVTLHAAASTSGTQYFVAPSGSAQGDGSQTQPWDLTTALNQPTAVQPGDTIWLRGGVYRGNFSSKLTGAAGSPITLRQRPGERATIDGSLAINGAYAWYWGFEVMRSNPSRGDSGSHADAVTVSAPNTKLINLVIHDGDADGIGFWMPAADSEIYGTLIYYNGFQGPDRGHGHGIYTQNSSGTKTISDNIIFDHFGLGIQAYGSSAAFVRGFVLDGNILFNNGSIAAGLSKVDNILFANGNPLERIRVENNYTYHRPADDNGYSRLGWIFGGLSQDVIARNNYWIGGASSIELWNWNSATFTNNTVYAKSLTTLVLNLLDTQSTSAYVWDNNTYYGSGLFRFNGQNRNWANWRSLSRLDTNSRYVTGRPAGVWSFVRANKYEAGRANIVLYNWDVTPSVAVDVSGVLTPGTPFEVRDAQNFFGAPVVAGIYAGGPITIPMTGLAPAAPVGSVPSPPRHTAPEFGAFVLVQK